MKTRNNIQQRVVYGEVKAVPADVDKTRTVTFIASTYSKDRHGTIVNQKGWKLDNFNRNPVIGYQHDVYGGGMCLKADPDDVIASNAKAYMDGDQLLVDVTFETEDVNAKAEKIFKKVKAGSLRAVSVGFLEIGTGRYGEGEEARGKAKETYYFDGQELLEVSVVNIPSNPDAVRKSLGDQTANALLYIRRNTGLSLSAIEKMTVREVLDVIEGNEPEGTGEGNTPPPPAGTPPSPEESTEPGPELYNVSADYEHFKLMCGF